MLNAYSKFDPFRSPQWRFERTLELVEHEPAPRRAQRCDDSQVRTYRNFLIRWRATQADDERATLFPRHPGLYYAQTWQFHADSEWRSLLQARILSRESPEKIAMRFGTLPSAVSWYEAIFFNVLDRIDCRDWIEKAVIASSASKIANRDGSLTASQRDLAYKIFGYFGGPDVLDILVSGLAGGFVPQGTKATEKWVDAAFKSVLKSRALTAAKTFEVNRYNVMQLFEITLGIMNHDFAVSGEGGGDQNEANAGISEFLQHVPWALSCDDKVARTPAQQRFERSRVEPRANESLALASDEVPRLLQFHEAKQTRATLETVNN